ANKMDLPEAQENYQRVAEFMEKEGREIFPVSAATGDGLPQLIQRASQLLNEYVAEPEVQSEVKVYEAKPTSEFTISREDDGAFVVHGKGIEKMVAMVNFDNDEGLRRFQLIYRRQGIEEALKQRGIKEGDTVRILDMEFEFKE
ncbi:MAG TPA: Obg family GTPase CgtA, partial [Negativicutes bacterium]